MTGVGSQRHRKEDPIIQIQLVPSFAVELLAFFVGIREAFVSHLDQKYVYPDNVYSGFPLALQCNDWIIL